MIDDSARCPCLSGEQYGGCCAPLHRGETEAPTAERLMRSRYSACALGELEYLRHSWHPATRPETLELEPGIRWYRLDIVRTEQGGMLDDEGVVEFRAFYRSDGGPGEQHEVSRFSRLDRRWVYLDAV